MEKKLTLLLDKSVIESAKEYAEINDTSLSSLVENYFKFLVGRQKPQKIILGPITRSLRGVAPYKGKKTNKELIREARLEKLL